MRPSVAVTYVELSFVAGWFLVLVRDAENWCGKFCGFFSLATCVRNNALSGAKSMRSWGVAWFCFLKVNARDDYVILVWDVLVRLAKDI